MMTTIQQNLKHLTIVKATVKDDQSKGDVAQYCIQCSKIAKSRVAWDEHLHPYREEHRLTASQAQEAQCCELMTPMELRLVPVTFLVTVVPEEMKSELRLPCFDGVSFIIDVDPIPAYAGTDCRRHKSLQARASASSMPRDRNLTIDQYRVLEPLAR